MMLLLSGLKDALNPDCLRSHVFSAYESVEVARATRNSFSLRIEASDGPRVGGSLARLLGNHFGLGPA